MPTCRILLSGGVNDRMEMERYAVRRHRELRFVLEALEQSGAKVLSSPNPNVAPFIIEILGPSGEKLELICYAFSANKYRQSGRPNDEHRFQVKYGSDFDRYHNIYIPAGEQRVTLMFGVHLEESIIVAVDPAMHNPTWFSRSVELKDQHVAAVHDFGWYGWERDRHPGGRRKGVMPKESYQTEVLLGLTPDRFMRYIQLERVATGIDPGERLLLIDQLAERPAPEAQVGPHPLEMELGLSAREILDMIDGAFRLKVAVRGSAAEQHLQSHLEAVSGMDEVVLIDADGQPDFRVVYRGCPPVHIECKNVLRRKTPGGLVKVDFQRTRASKKDPCSRYYQPLDFQVLAACLHPVTEEWEFRFCETLALPQHKSCPGRLASNVVVEDGIWTGAVEEMLVELCRKG